MAEVLLVARKSRPDLDSNALFVNLERRPESVTEAADVARAIRQIDDYSGWLYCGSYCAGSYVHDEFTDSGAAGVRNPDLVRTMQMLAKGLLHLPRLDGNRELPIAPLSTLGTRGPVDRDVNGWSGREPRGPWDIVKLDEAEDPPTWPALWAHDAERERRLIVEPDRAGRVRPGCRKLALSRWKTTASRLHFNRLFQINSQSLVACLTPEPAIGGQAWPSFHPRVHKWAEPLALWANTTLGLMAHWWHGTRTQLGRSRLTISRIPALPCLDPELAARDRDGWLDDAHQIFERFQHGPFLPANEAYRDETRHKLDRAVLVDLLGVPKEVLEELDLLRVQWCSEPSVHGGKGTRPL